MSSLATRCAVDALGENACEAPNGSGVVACDVALNGPRSDALRLLIQAATHRSLARAATQRIQYESGLSPADADTERDRFASSEQTQFRVHGSVHNRIIPLQIGSEGATPHRRGIVTVCACDSQRSGSGSIETASLTFPCMAVFSFCCFSIADGQNSHVEETGCEYLGQLKD